MPHSHSQVFQVRLFQPGDEDAVYEVCLRTGDAGKDGTHLYSDSKILGHIYVGPYMRFEPEFAFVLTDHLGLCGYVLGALDSWLYYKRYEEEWLPRIRQRFSCPAGDPGSWSPTERLCHELHFPQIYLPETFRGYPSHLHIDLLPRAQGKGQGRPMIETLMDALRARGSIGVHLGMAASNSRAERFYRKLGFTDLALHGPPEDATLFLGKRLAESN